MAALLSANLNDLKTLEEYMSESKRMGISVLSPDINESQMQFSSNAKGDIRFGLAAIKGVGEGAVASIIAEREKNGPFKNIYDFAERANYSAINRKCFENIAMSGGFDSIIDFSRGKFMAIDDKGESFVEALVRYGSRIQNERNNAQQSLFGGDSGVSDIQKPAIPVRGDAVQLELLNKEKELIGMYLSAHPLDEYKLLLNSVCKCTLSDLSELEKFNGKEIAVAGIVTETSEFYLKNGTPAGKMVVMDYNGMHEFAFFRKDYEMFRTRMFKDYFLLIQGRVQPRQWSKDGELEFKVTSITQLSDVRDAVREIKLYLSTDKVTREFIDELIEVAKASKGKAQLKFSLQDLQEEVLVSAYSRKYKVALTDEIAKFIEKHNLTYTITVNQ
jgi:DNA polymerase-3 subunit alpha